MIQLTKRAVCAIGAAFLILSVGSVTAGDDEYIRAEPVDAWVFSADQCLRQTKAMNRLIKSWESGKILRPDIPMPPITRPDGSLYNPNQGRLFYITYKTHQLSVIETFGDIYYNGCPKAGVEPNKDIALEMYARAALNHVPSAQFKLGKMWFEGDGVRKQEEVGLSWITSAALEGSDEAAAYLAAINQEVPEPISPTSYAIAALEAKAIHEGLKQVERAKIVSDLAGLAVNFAGGYLAGMAAQPAVITRRPASAASPVTPAISSPMPIMTQPRYCDYYVTANSYEPSGTVFANVSRFCR